METKEKKEITPEEGLAWFIRRQKRKAELQAQFQKDCDSGKVDKILQNGKPVNR